MPVSGHPQYPIRRWRAGLGRHLVLVLILKVLVLTGLWHAFIKPNQVKVDAGAMSARMAEPSNQTTRENSHDRFNGR